MYWNLKQLEVFAAVVEGGGFTAAGKQLGMVQPAVSITIKKLEENVGVTLLERLSSGVRPTIEGEMFFKNVQMIRAELSAFEKNLSDIRNLNSGHVHIGAPPVISSFLLPQMVKNFLDEYDGVRVSCSAGSSPSIIERLRGRELDFGFIAGHQNVVGLEAELIEEHPLVAWCAPDSELAKLKNINWKRLLEFPLIMFPKGFNQRTMVDETARELGIEPNIIIEAESTRMLGAMVSSGRGVSVILQCAAQQYPENIAIPIVGRPSIPFWICKRQNAMSSIAASAFFASVTQRSKSAQKKLFKKKA